MLSISIIVFREVLEIAMILGVVMAVTRGLVGRRRWTAAGILGGLLGSAVVAYFTGAISNTLDGMGQEVFNALVLILATGLIGWTVVWMKSHSAALVRQIKDVGKSVAAGEVPLHMLSVVVGLAMLREGSEIVLFIYGAIASGTPFLSVLAGFTFGLISGSAVGAALYFGLLTISPKHFFSVTSFLLIFLAAGMLLQAVGLLTAVGWLPEGISPLWDTSAILSEKHVLGQLANALFGYTARPSAAQAFAYFATVAGLLFLNHLYSQPGKGKNHVRSKRKSNEQTHLLGLVIYGRSSNT
ncbi:MAG: FTR1 family protein [Candidatus Omnitrophota bacterium]|nr:FTR1 family protein [Candidatus Omnitrophota bacterium]